MYQAKKNNEGFAIYSSAIGGKLERHDIIARDLNDAIAKDQFRLYYQPIVLGHSHAMKGVEALIRWQHPELGFIPPDEFIAYAERSNMIKKLTDWVLNRALVDGEYLQSQGYEMSISVNISGRLVSDSTFPEHLAEIIERYNYPTRLLTLELTESSAMRNPQQSMATLVGLKRLGVNLSIDDFGTGYSSFSYLARLPVDELKIDRSFLSDLDDNSQAVIEAIITLAHRLRLKVVAEGVENDSILQIVEGFGCDYIQGYHFCRPVPPEELIAWINDQSATRTPRASLTPMLGVPSR